MSPTPCFTCGHYDAHTGGAVGVCLFPRCGCDGPLDETTPEQKKAFDDLKAAFKLRWRIDALVRSGFAASALRRIAATSDDDGVYHVARPEFTDEEWELIQLLKPE